MAWTIENGKLVPHGHWAMNLWLIWNRFKYLKDIGWLKEEK